MGRATTMSRACMGSLNMFIVVYTAALAMGVLYGPQPLLSTIQAEFTVDRSTVSLIITLPLLPLGLVPVAYGYLLESISAKKLLATAVALLCVSQMSLSLLHDFRLLLVLRLIQGIAFPALFTSLMTYTASTNHSDNVQRAMSLYIGATILGGFGGRILSGFLATFFGWQASMLFFGLALAINLLLLFFLKSDTPASLSRLKISAIKRVLAIPGFKVIYLLVFCIFFVFAAVFNLLPFRMTDITGGVSEFKIGLMYTGQGIGIIIALFSTRICSVLGQPPRIFLSSLLIFLTSLFFFLIPSVAFIFLNMFLFASGMFFIHTTAPGYLNRVRRENSGVVNGTYLMVYYLGGALGTYVPAMIYMRWGWTTCILFLALIVCVALAAVAWTLKNTKTWVCGT
jgi:YNFM family putative membrane transporter